MSNQEGFKERWGLTIFILKRPFGLFLEKGREGGCGQWGGCSGVDIDMEISGWPGQIFRRQGLALAKSWCLFGQRESW